MTFLNDNSNALMVIITAIYVAATIAICWFNHKSAKASVEQVDEMRRQYKEEHRPRLEAEVVLQERKYVFLRVVNHGMTTAKNVMINIHDDFISNERDESIASLIRKQRGKECIIGADQHYDLLLGTIESLRSKSRVLEGKISYYGNDVAYDFPIHIDFENYMTFFSAETFEEKLLKAIEKQK